MTYPQIARTVDLRQSSAQVCTNQHRRLLNRGPRYASGAAELATACLATADGLNEVRSGACRTWIQTNNGNRSLFSPS